MTSANVTHKILILSANPKQTTSLRLDEEVREIKEGLKRAQSRELFSIESAEATRYKDIRRAILDHAPTIIHFSGHGVGQDGLIFEDETGLPRMVDTEAIGGLFQLFRDKVKCVVLNACYSDSQAQEIAKHINHVIGMSQAIDDKAAIEFSVAFYDALGAKKSYYFAYQLGCNAIKMAGIPQESIPQWYGEKTERVEGPELTDGKQADSLIPKMGAEKMTGGHNINIGTGDYRSVKNGDYRETSIHDQGSYAEGDYYNNVAAKSSLTEAANEIQQLLDQLSKNNSTTTMTGKMKIAGEVIEEIENNPALMKRVTGALKAGGVSAFEQALNHPSASFVIGALEEWQNSKT
ncbi:CHAT domain-containing protein [Laspinema olomoucense]|uniref:CHAT domain-containing protein n=1 Tax=Laspinema olomoucense D3b TaxID=2953688 RepID=A0ABT2N7L2_9CYAN|nr:MULTISPECIES: CHAT domain-containing protein [unclassified Laspinema]MCT7978672.1 CHAT domain-containing protein [Laspinema sp. D3b]MCT7992336.1 CHAT domain-containing protein [Laspinema sp. D3c]